MSMKEISYSLIREHIGSISLRDGLHYNEVEELLGPAFPYGLIYHAYLENIDTTIYSKKSVYLYIRSGNGLHDFYSKKEARIIMREKVQ